MARMGRVFGVLATALALGAAVMPALAAASSAVASGVPRVVAVPSYGNGGMLSLFYTSPVLVRAGERVLIPVDASCSIGDGMACSGTVSFSVQEGDGPWREVSAPASTDLRFDLTGPASRVIADSAPSGSVGFVVRATDDRGRSMSLPGGRGASLRFYVVRDMPSIRLPALRFGATRRGTRVLFLPWGTGGMRAGLVPGGESLTLGPSSFDVDARGDVYLLDGLQERLAVFSNGGLVRQTRVDVGPWADVAVGPDGSAHLLTTDPTDNGHLVVRHVGPDGRSLPSTSVGPGIPSQIRAVGSNVFVHTLPLEAGARRRVRTRRRLAVSGDPRRTVPDC